MPPAAFFIPRFMAEVRTLFAIYLIINTCIIIISYKIYFVNYQIKFFKFTIILQYEKIFYLTYEVKSGKFYYMISTLVCLVLICRKNFNKIRNKQNIFRQEVNVYRIKRTKKANIESGR